MSAGPRGRDGVPERPSCKYPASILQVCLRHIAPTIKQGGALLPEFKSAPVN